MLKKILYWFLGILLLLAIVVAGVAWYADDYLESNQEKLLQDFMSTKGMSVAVREIRLQLWEDFPEVSVTVDSLVVRDTTGTDKHPTLINVQRLKTRVTLKDLLTGRIHINEVTVIDGTLHLESDSTGRFNLGDFTQRDTTAADDEPKEDPYLSVDWEGLNVELDRVDIHFIHPLKKKRIEVVARKVTATVDRNGAGDLYANTDLDLDFTTLAFNTDKGGFLQGSPLKGLLNVTFGKDLWTIEPATLNIGNNDLVISAEISTEKADTSHIHIATDSISYAEARAILSTELQEKMGRFDASGRFPVSADILTPLTSGVDPEVTVAFRFTGQSLRVKQYDFLDVHGTGSFVNRLTVEEGGIPNSKRNIRVLADNFAATYLGSIRIETPHLKMAVAGTDPILHSNVHLYGPAKGISDYLKNDAFFFRRGRFTMDAEVHASLLSFEDLVETTDGQINFYNTSVYYGPGGVNFPFASIAASKRGQDIDFTINSQRLKSGFAFDLTGKLDNIVPLLVEKPSQRITSDVTLHTGRFDWKDFRALFGEDGRLVLEDEGVPTKYGTGAKVSEGNSQIGVANQKELTEETDAQQVAAMKLTLLGIEEAFHPNITMKMDTVAYYDVFTLTDFTTGLHFKQDTLVLERSRFNWSGSEMDFAARMNMSGIGETPFVVDFRADHLNVNSLRTSLDYFGLALPKGMETLPSDLHIEFNHAGKIADSIGIVAGSNYGELVFNDGRDNLFAGNLTYAPSDTPGGLQTKVHLNGDPQVVNVLFAAENFFFGEGNFTIDLDLDGTPEDLPSLLKNSTLRLSIDSSRVLYRPADVYIPIRRFNVDVANERADYSLTLVTDSTNRSVNMTGYMDQLATFMFPDSTRAPEPFRMKADVRAGSLGLADLEDFIQTNIGDGEEAVDTTKNQLKSVLSATSGVFNSFRPDLSLQIDTFFLSPENPLLDLATGIRVRDEKELVLEQTGFTIGEGRVELDAVYALDRLDASPFKVNWKIENVDLDLLLGEFAEMSQGKLKNTGDVQGALTLTGNMTSLLDEKTQQIIFDSTQGTINYRMENIVLKDWEQLTAVGEKAKMAHRFQRLGLAPLAGQLEMRDGEITIPRTEIQSTALHLFLEGNYSLENGPDLLVSVPVFKNIKRGILRDSPPKTGYARAGWKVYLVMTKDKAGESKTKFRLLRKKYFKERGLLEEYNAHKAKIRAERKHREKD
ncbi:AsmA family protein [Neolewinella antarctica]|uniref:Uncharacterized protein involved in outer membrane biogenesis n=1 Tax=Neolewinella antarctica TaxID=442734 RepID=A0ABX0XEV1_9BACT|nr:AsmA family protein [Neolewinella antarctica]NJC27850.1 uncharacterized protein involved in outer membrane biogenesis [Neolewinella antarctica]